MKAMEILRKFILCLLLLCVMGIYPLELAIRGEFTTDSIANMIALCLCCMLTIMVQLVIHYVCRKSRQHFMRWVISWMGIIIAAYACLAHGYSLLWPTSYWSGLLTLIVLVVGLGGGMCWYYYHHKENSNWRVRDVPFLVVAGYTLILLYYAVYHNQSGGIAPAGGLDSTVLFYHFLYTISFTVSIINMIFNANQYSRWIVCISSILFVTEAIILTIAMYDMSVLFVIHAIAVVIAALLPAQQSGVLKE